MGSMTTIELIKLLMPVIVFQVGFALFCVVMIWRKGVRNLNKPLWTVIVVFVNLIGPVIFLIVGRKRWSDDIN